MDNKKTKLISAAIAMIALFILLGTSVLLYVSQAKKAALNPEISPVPAVSALHPNPILSTITMQISPLTPSPIGSLIRIGTLAIPVEIAATEDAKEKGLSGRPLLPQNQGMLFLFEKPGIYRFWMPDMHFPIDIIWMDSTRTVVDISADVSNQFDPEHPRYYTPSSPARYVLEVNAGFAARNGINKGDVADFVNFSAD